MKTQTVTREPVAGDRLSKACQPRVSYHQAMDLYFLARSSGAIVTVKRCTSLEMQHLVEESITTLNKPGACQKALEKLDYTQLLDRWFAVETLQVYRACAPLYTSFTEAQIAQNERTQTDEFQQFLSTGSKEASQ